MQVQVFLDRSPFCTACPASLPSPYARAGLFAYSITASRYHLPAPFDSLAAVYSARTGLTRAILNVVHSLVISTFTAGPSKVRRRVTPKEALTLSCTTS